MANFTVSLHNYVVAVDGKVRGTDPGGVYVANLPANSIYIDNTLTADITDGSYSIASRNNTGTDGNAYTTIQAAINAAIVGDTLLMRGGTYSEIDIGIPESLNGTAWTDGNYTTLKSYPGEWAKVDGTGLNDLSNGDWLNENVFTNHALTGYGPGDALNYNEYWLFSNFEVTGGRNGFFMKMRHCRFKFMYVHDNGRLYITGVYDQLVAGIMSVCPQYVEIKFCWLLNNQQTNAIQINNSNVLFDSDYRDDSGTNGLSLIPTASTHHNEVAYNYMYGSAIGLRQKNQQRFGLNNRNPNDMTYNDYGDKWHHNIILNTSEEAIGASQDFVQIYNNICEFGINIGRRAGTASDIPQIYNAVAYNNTIKSSGTGAGHGWFATSAGYEVTTDNYYDNSGQKTIHEHIDLLNNIVADIPAGNPPFRMHTNMPADVSNPDQDNADLVIDHNLVHNSSASVYADIGPDTSTGCADAAKTVDTIDTCQDTWQSLTPGTRANWESSTAGLWVGTTGADQYKTVGTFNVDTGITIANGGVTTHPYLAVTLPSYVGASNPSDNAWITNLNDNVPTIAWLTAQTSDPTWIEA